MSPAAPVPPDDDLAPDAAIEEVRYIRDVEALRAISDPTRMQVLETMVQRRSPAWNVKEIAARLGLPQTRLYHHIEILVSAGLVRPVERRVVSGIIETRYLPAALSFQLDRSLFAGEAAAGLEVLHQTLATIFDTARAEVERAIRSGAVAADEDAPPDRRLLVWRGVARLSPARANELRERLTALANEFSDEDVAADAGVEDPGAIPLGIVLAVYPLINSSEDSNG